MRFALFPRTRPKKTAARLVTFGVLASFLPLLEILLSRNMHQPPPSAVIFTIIFCASMFLSGWYPAIGGSACVLIFLTGDLFPGSMAMLGFPVLGLCIIMADWVSTGWNIQAALALLLVFGVDLSMHPGLGIPFAAMASAGIIAVIVGLVLRITREKMAHLQEQADASHRAALQASEAVKRDVAAVLHSTVASDLARVIITAQSIDPDMHPAEGDKVRALADMSRETMKHLRTLINVTAPEYSNQQEKLSKTLSDCSELLSGRGIDLDIDSPGDLDLLGTAHQRSVLSVVLREAAVNIMKYGQSKSRANLVIEKSQDGSVAMTIVNSIERHAHSDNDGLSGGFGLNHLQAIVRDVGGTCDCGQSGERWLLSVTLPMTSTQV